MGGREESVGLREECVCVCVAGEGGGGKRRREG